MNDVTFEVQGLCAVITLNRVNALNALSPQMILSIMDKLNLWRNNNKIKAIVIKANGEKGFCAGADLKFIYNSSTSVTETFFYHEYQLNKLIKSYPKPYISLIHGVTMGGGVGLSIHASHRIASPDLIWAMPETGIGFFPDVGTNYILSRLTDGIGNYLGLTGKRINIETASELKFIDYIVDKSNFNLLIAELSTSNLSIEDSIKKFSLPRKKVNSLEKNQIQTHFHQKSLAKILGSLQKCQSAWCKQTLKDLNSKSPTSLKTTFHAISNAQFLSFNESIDLELTIAKKIIPSPDFYEGIRAAIVDKDHSPKWQHFRY